MDYKKTINIAQKILAYILENEPVDDISELVEKSGLPEGTIKLNIERLHRAGLLEGTLVKTLGSQRFVQVDNLMVSYEGIKELGSLFGQTPRGKPAVALEIGELKFELNLIKVF